MVATTFAEVLLMALNELMSPLPLAAKPMEVVLFVQLKTVLGTAKVDAKLIAPVAAPLHTIIGDTPLTVGFGLTVIVKVVGTPGQPFAVGVTVIVDEIGELEAFVVTKAGIVAPEPEAAKLPIAVLLLVQE